MSDNKPPAQIINLFEVMRDQLFARQYQGSAEGLDRDIARSEQIYAEQAKRSAGDVPAPTKDDQLEATLATSCERAATLKLLRELGGQTKSIVARKWLKQARETIEKGEHLK